MLIYIFIRFFDLAQRIREKQNMLDSFKKRFVNSNYTNRSDFENNTAYVSAKYQNVSKKVEKKLALKC